MSAAYAKRITVKLQFANVNEAENDEFDEILRVDDSSASIIELETSLRLFRSHHHTTNYTVAF